MFEKGWYSFRTILLFAGLWWILSDGDALSWVIGVPTILIATAISRKLGSTRPPAVSLSALPRFLGYFAVESLRSGVDVAHRALAPGRHVEPAVLTYTTTLPCGWPRTLLANVVSLMPGSLSVSLAAETLTVHALDKKSDTRGGIASCERIIARLVKRPG